MIALLILTAAQPVSPELNAFDRYRSCVIRHFRVALPTYPAEFRFNRATSACSGQRAITENDLWRITTDGHEPADADSRANAQRAFNRQLKELDQSLKSEILSGKFEVGK